MYNFVLLLHSLVRWAVVIFGLVAVVRAFMGWFGKGRWAALDDRLGIGFTSALDLNVLFGLLLYFLFSPITTAALGDFGGAMGNPGVRFFAVEHILMMLVALIVAHIGRSRARKATTDLGKFKQTAIFFGVALLLVLAAIPWPFMAVGAGRGWF